MHRRSVRSVMTVASAAGAGTPGIGRAGHDRLARQDSRFSILVHRRRGPAFLRPTRRQALAVLGNNDAGQLDAPTEQSFVHIAAGAGHTCALNADGEAVCWGDNSFSQGTPPAKSRFISLTAGELHTCGLQPDGIALCWGSDVDSQASPPDGLVFTQLSAGAHHTAASRQRVKRSAGAQIDTGSRRLPGNREILSAVCGRGLSRRAGGFLRP